MTEDHLNRLPDQVARNRVRALEFAFVLQFDLSRDGWKRGVDVRDARNDVILARNDRPPLRIADHGLETRYRQTLADAGPLIDALIGARLERDRFDHLLDELRNKNGPA